MKNIIKSYENKIDDLNYYLCYKTLKYKNFIMSKYNGFDDAINFGKCNSDFDYFHNELSFKYSVNQHTSCKILVKTKIEIKFTHEEI